MNTPTPAHPSGQAPALDHLLNLTQQSQLAAELRRVISHGWGSLRLRIEKGQLRWLYPALIIYTPNGERPERSATRSLPEMLGPWASPFALSLAQLMGDGYGDLVLNVEHSLIRSIVAAPDVRVRTGDTDKLARPGA